MAILKILMILLKTTLNRTGGNHVAHDHQKSMTGFANGCSAFATGLQEFIPKHHQNELKTGSVLTDDSGIAGMPGAAKW
jgi:hypothetical protein